MGACSPGQLARCQIPVGRRRTNRYRYPMQYLAGSFPLPEFLCRWPLRHSTGLLGRAQHCRALQHGWKCLGMDSRCVQDPVRKVRCQKSQRRGKSARREGRQGRLLPVPSVLLLSLPHSSPIFHVSGFRHKQPGFQAHFRLMASAACLPKMLWWLGETAFSRSHTH